MAAMSNVPDCADCMCGDSPACAACLGSAGDLNLRVHREGFVSPESTFDDFDLVLHRRDSTIVSAVPPPGGPPAYFTGGPPYWYTDVVEAPTGTALRWTRFFPFCGPAGEFILRERGWASESEAEAALVFDFSEGVDTLAIGSSLTGLHLACARRSCDPIYLMYEGENNVAGVGPVTWVQFIVASGDPGVIPDTLPPVSRQVCVTAHAGACDTTPVAPGIEVSFGPEGGEPTATGTTDADGRVCFAAAGPGDYEVSGEIDGCPFSRPVAVSSCGTGDIEVPLTFCCATVLLRVLDFAEAPVVGATVAVLGEDLVTDSGGEVTVELTTARMLALAEGTGGCTTRLLPVSITRSGDPGVGTLTYCPEIEVSCGEDGATAHVEHVARKPPNTIEWACCEDDGCEVQGPEGRGLMHTKLFVTYSATATRGSDTWTYFFEHELDLVTGGGVPSLGGLGGVLHRSGCVNGSGFITPGAEGCGELADETQDYLSAQAEIESCLGGPPRFRAQFYQLASCNSAGQTEGERPDCDTLVTVDQEIPTDVQSLCVGETITETWEQALEGGSIVHSLAVTGVTE